MQPVHHLEKIRKNSLHCRSACLTHFKGMSQNKAHKNPQAKLVQFHAQIPGIYLKWFQGPRYAPEGMLAFSKNESRFDSSSVWDTPHNSYG